MRVWLQGKRALAGGLLMLLGVAAAAAPVSYTVVNQANAAWHEPLRNQSVTASSNVVVTEAAGSTPAVRFYADDRYVLPVNATRSGLPIYVAVNAAKCNVDPARIESISVQVVSKLTGATSTYLANETSPNSGQFRVVANASTSTSGGAARPPAANDTLNFAVASCGGDSFSADLLVDPQGIVFDAISNAPVAGATVLLIDVTGAGNGGRAGEPARVFDVDGVTPWPSTQVTAADGRFSFPLVAPSGYRLAVTPPSGYTFASKRAADQMPAGRTILVPGSFGGRFDVVDVLVTLDVPLDAIRQGLVVQKMASRTTAEIAESVDYTVTVRNVGEQPLDAATLRDDLPAGFSYVRGSARLDGMAVADPAGGRGPVLDFPLGSLPVAATKTLRYRALIGPGALQGDGINRAQARSPSPSPVSSNVATAKVKVEAGVFTDKAMVLGVVFADCNANGLKDTDEVGAPGVRIYLENGSFVITDGEGRYSFYGVSPRTHVLKVDAASLPAGARLRAISNRNAGVGGTRFIDAKRGELARGDFALEGCSPELLQGLAKRRAALADDRELQMSLKSNLTTTATALLPGDVRSLAASGLVGQTSLGAPSSVGMGTMPDAGTTRSATSPSTPAGRLDADAKGSMDDKGSVPQAMTLEQRLPTLKPGLAFIDLRDDQTVADRPLTVQVQARLGAQIGFTVNGVAQGDAQIGQRAQSQDTAVELREYVGVVLKQGNNVLALTEHDGFGNLRASQSLRLQVAGPIATLQLVPAQAVGVADGISRTAVTMLVLDAQGLSVLNRTAVTLQTTLGEWDVRDLNLQEPGVQTFVDGGQARFELRAPNVAGDAVLHASASGATGTTRVAFTPELRPLLMVGVVEGVINLRKFDLRSLTPARSSDGFDAELREFASGGESSIGARAALFIKGKIRGDYLLTVGYDSDKNTRERLFRDIRPDEFYPVYGDASVKGFDAQSTGRLYVRVERNKSYLLIGDFTTQSATAVRQLGAYQRSLNGIKEHFHDERFSITAFASRDSTRQVVTETRANGTSGPYFLARGDVIVNSERVEVLVRDRNQPSLVLSATPQQRFADYDFEPITGRLLFRAPLPSLDADLNPVSVRVTYEAEQGGPAFWVGGVNAEFRPTDAVKIGASAVKDLNPMQPFQLASVNAEVKLTDVTLLSVEAAQVQRDADESGTAARSGAAQRVELLHNGTALKARVYVGRSDVGFDNPSSTLSSGRREAGIKSSYALDERTRLVGDAIHTSDAAGLRGHEGVLLGVERSFGGGTKLELGLRRARSLDPGVAAGVVLNQGTGPIDTTSVRAKFSAIVPGVPNASAFVEAEQDVNDADKRLLAVGGEYQMVNRGRLYLRHELVSSLGSVYALDATQRRNTTVVGLDSEVARDMRMFSEYRARDAFTGREAEAAIGLRNQWTLAEGLRVNASFERVHELAGDTQNESAAVTGAVEYTHNALWKATARMEWRQGDLGAGVLSTFGLAHKLNRDWTFLGKNVYSVTEDKRSNQRREQERLQMGVAYRDSETNLRNGLSRYEFKREKGTLGDEAAREVHLVSNHLDHQVHRNLWLTGEYAAKRVNERLNGQPTSSSAQLIATRATLNVGSSWDVGLAFRVLANKAFSSRQSGLGLEIGRVLRDNLWLSAGYNVTGFKDRDLTGDNYTDRGAFVRLRFKFDESLLTAKKP